MTPIEKAKAVVTRLEKELAAVTNKATAAATERRRLSYSAHGCGDEKARAELSSANAASAALALDAENLRSAIEDAKRHVVEAEREVDAGKRREVARQAKAIIAEAETFGEVMTDGLDRLCEGFAAFAACLEKLERLGYPVATSRLRYLAYTRAIQGRLHGTGLGFDIVAPYLRHDLASLNANYMEHSRNKVAEDLGTAAAVADAEAA
jgi:hypothetical protein